MRQKAATPAQRYRLAIARGESPESARHTVASSYGLETNVVRLGSDGTEKVVAIPWTIEDIARILFFQWLIRTGRLNDDHAESTIPAATTPSFSAPSSPAPESIPSIATTAG